MQNQNKSKIELIKIDEDQAGQRIDNFLLNKLKNVPKTHVYKLLRKGEVRVNKKRVKAEYKIQADDIIRIPPIMQVDGNDPNRKLSPKLNIINILNNRIIYEDDNLLIINKPSGMASHGGSGINFGVIETLRAARPEARYLELAHRLDRGTSGCLIIAKKRSILRVLHELLRHGRITKKYLLLVKGKWQGGDRKVNVALAKNNLVSGERFVKVSEAENAKDSLTIFRPVKVYTATSLLEAELKSGRTHQIRVHAAHIGFPIAGDDKYGYDVFNKLMKEKGLSRIFLHAAKISFKLSDASSPINVRAELEEELLNVLNKL